MVTTVVGAAGKEWGGTRDAAQHPAVHRMPPAPPREWCGPQERSVQRERDPTLARCSDKSRAQAGQSCPINSDGEHFCPSDVIKHMCCHVK